MAVTAFSHQWIYQSPAQDLIELPSAVLRRDATVRDVVGVIGRYDDCVAIVADNGTLMQLADTLAIIGWFARGLSMNDTLPPPSSTAVRTIGADASVLATLAHMIAHQQSCVAILDNRGLLKGVVRRDRILAKAAGFVWDIARAAGAEEVGKPRSGHAMRDLQASIAEDMLAAELPTEAILATISGINIEVHRYVLADAVVSMENDGWGKPPVPFSFIVLGSSGRLENFLDTDQDNALIIGESRPEPEQREQAQTYFIALSQRLADGLAASGFPHCKGNMMATSPVWRKTESEWSQQIRIWVRRKEPILLMNCDALLDMAHVAGAADLAGKLHQDLVRLVSREPGFLRALYSIEENHGVGLDWFGQLTREKDIFGPVAEVNLKLRGLLPLIEGARLLAVGAGIRDTSTVARLRALVGRGVVSEDTITGLVESYRLIAAQLLHHQIATLQSRASSPVNVTHDSMSPAQRTALRSALRRIATFRSQLPSLLESTAQSITRT
ncbi:MAG: DUF294 nucleotidyltransferase-like domain-containing protein [Hyphomicrobiaceae bacterium]